MINFLKEHKIALGVGILLLGIIGYVNSDISASVSLKRTNDVIEVENSTFDIRSEYSDGKIIARVRSYDINGDDYSVYKFFLDDSMSVLDVLYLDDEGFVVKNIPFTKHDLNIAESSNNLMGKNGVYLTKEEVRKIKSMNIIAKKLIINER